MFLGGSFRIVGNYIWSALINCFIGLLIWLCYPVSIILQILLHILHYGRLALEIFLSPIYILFVLLTIPVRVMFIAFKVLLLLVLCLVVFPLFAYFYVVDNYDLVELGQYISSYISRDFNVVLP